jgi:RND family efflux transporter MFP subunit
MSAWKQLLFSLVILAAAVAAWANFYPGARQVLTPWKLDWLIVAGAGDAADGKGGAGGQGGGQGGGGQNRGQPANVVTMPATLATINDRLQAIGTGRARASVTVTPYDSGRLMEIGVRSGAEVKAGDVIARLDAETEEIAVDRARIARDDAAAKLERIKALLSSNTATTVQVSEAETVLRNADLALRDAELALARRSVLAPISGVVGILPVETGNYVTSQTAVATIDDRSTIVVDFWVPERYATAVKVGAPLTASLVARPSGVFDGTVSAVDNRLDEQSRTLRVQAGIANPDDSLRAGMSFQVTMKFPGDTYPAVSPLAIQWGTDGAFVWVVREGKAKRTPVRIVQRNTENVLVDAPIGEGEMVVTEGVQNVREGSDVLVAGEPRVGAANGVQTASDGT